jgi:hypothetical protein
MMMLPRNLEGPARPLAGFKRLHPAAYSDRVILFRSVERPLMWLRNSHAGWTKYATHGVEVHVIDGDRDNILF